MENLERLVEGRIDSYQMEKRYYHARGAVVWAQLSVSLVRDEAGKPLQFISQIQDVTEQMHAREALRMQADMLDNIGQSVIATDMTGGVIYANRFAGQLYGWSPEEMIGRKIVEITVPHSGRLQAEEILAALQRGENWSGEFLVQDRAGAHLSRTSY
jgi:PAS domain-containing protein